MLKRDIKRASKETMLKLFEYCPGVTPKNWRGEKSGRKSVIVYQLFSHFNVKALRRVETHKEK